MVQFKGIKNKQEYQRWRWRASSPSTASTVPDEPAFPRQHRADHARRGGRRDGRRARAPMSRPCSTTCGRTPKKMDDAEVITRPLTAAGLDARAHLAPHPGPGRQGPRCSRTPKPPSPAATSAPHLLRGRRDVLRQGPLARRRGRNHSSEQVLIPRKFTPRACPWPTTTEILRREIKALRVRPVRHHRRHAEGADGGGDAVPRRRRAGTAIPTASSPGGGARTSRTR